MAATLSARDAQLGQSGRFHRNRSVVRSPEAVSSTLIASVREPRITMRIEPIFSRELDRAWAAKVQRVQMAGETQRKELVP